MENAIVFHGIIPISMIQLCPFVIDLAEFVLKTLWQIPKLLRPVNAHMIVLLPDMHTLSLQPL